MMATTPLQTPHVAVTGGAGFIGSHLVEAALELGWQVTVLDDLSTGHRDNLPRHARLRFVEGSITDPRACTEAIQRASHVVHLAARGSVPRSMATPVDSLQVNVLGTQRVLDAARAAGIQRFVQASSSSVYGARPGLPRVESMPTDPRSPYAASKVAAEQLAHVAAATHRLSAVSLRFFNVYGPRQRADARYAAVVPVFVQAAREHRAAQIHGTGQQRRDFTWVGDVAGALIAATTGTLAAGHHLWNVCTGRDVSILELHAAIGRAVGDATPPTFSASRAGDVPCTQGDDSRIREALCWSARVPLHEGLRRTLAWHPERTG